MRGPNSVMTMLDGPGGGGGMGAGGGRSGGFAGGGASGGGGGWDQSGGSGNATLASSGAGFRADVTRFLDVDLEVAVPLTEPRYDTDDRSPRINLRVSQSF